MGDRPFSRPEQTNRGPKLERSAEKRKKKEKRKSNSKAGFIAIWTRERDREQSNMESMNTALQQQRLEVEQLRREAAMKRIPVSKAVEDIKAYIRDHNQEDCLLTGFHGKNSNPFREKSSCEVL